MLLGFSKAVLYAQCDGENGWSASQNVESPTRLASGRVCERVSRLDYLSGKSHQNCEGCCSTGWGPGLDEKETMKDASASISVS